MLQDLNRFLASDWRRRPAFFENAVDVSGLELSLATLAGFATNDLVESRLVNAAGDVVHGPFEIVGESPEFLPDGYMLMVQCLEQHLPEIDRLLQENFGFLARWQIDDVMASVGETDISCGAHFDRYDVFLLQVRGEKRWLLDEVQHSEEELRNDVDARLLETFEPTREIIAKPGDLLYVPAGAGHLGECRGESLTLSVGIRNPSMDEVLADLASDTLANQDLSAPVEQELHPDANIPVGVAGQLKSQLDRVLDAGTLRFWYGCYVTRLREPELIQPHDHTEKTDQLAVSLPTRLALMADDNQNFWFVNGEGYAIEPEDLQALTHLTDQRFLDYPFSCSEMLDEIVDELVEAGALYFVS